MRNWKIVYTTFLILIAYVSYGQGALTLSVSDKVIGSRDALQATYSFKNLTPETPPSVSFRDWDNRGQSNESSTTIINGAVTRSVSFTFTLLPKHLGTLVVPGISVNINGKAYTCDAVKVTVKKQPHLTQPGNPSAMAGRMPGFPFPPDIFGTDDAAPRPPASGVVVHPGQTYEEAARERFFIKITPSAPTCYIGEPILVNYEFLGSVNCSWKPVKFPSFSSFSVTDIDQNLYPYNVEVNGKRYRAQGIRKVQLVPLKTGTIPLDSASVNCQAAFVNSNDMFNSQTANVTIKSKPISIQVLPLPLQGRPDNFSGAIGKFTITAYVDKNKLPAGENDILHIRISGTGNLDGVTLPDIDWPKLIQSYDAKDSQSVDKSQYPMPRSLNFDIPFIGNEEGVTVIPSVRFSYFDTDKKTYVTDSTDKIQLAFTPPLADKQPGGSGIVNHTTNTTYLWIVAGMALLIIGIFLFSETKKKKKAVARKDELPAELPDEGKASIAVSPEPEHPQQERKGLLRESLEELEHENDPKQFFVLAKALLIQCLQDKVHSSSEDEHRLLTKLQAESPADEPVYNQLIARCNKALYLPVSSAAEQKEMLEAIRQLIH